MEYNSVVWSPSNIQDIMRIERVQRKFTKALPGYKVLSYVSRLNQLGLLSLELRRQHTDLIVCYKIVFRLVDVSFNDFFQYPTDANTQGHTCIQFSCSRSTAQTEPEKSIF